MLNFKGTSVDQSSSRCTGCMKVKISFKKIKSIYFLSTLNKNQKLLDTNFVILSIHIFPWGHVTDWAEIFCGHSWVAGGCYRLKKFSNFFLHFFPRATPGLSATNKPRVNHKGWDMVTTVRSLDCLFPCFHVFLQLQLHFFSLLNHLIS